MNLEETMQSIREFGNETLYNCHQGFLPDRQTVQILIIVNF